MTLDELRTRYPHASASFLRRNADASMAPLPDRDAKHRTGRTLEQAHKRPAQSTRGPAYRVAFISIRARELDDDNLVAGCKQLRDVVAAHLGLADDKKSIRFSYGQMVSQGEQGTIIMIERLQETIA